jgi:hypothetical protein
MATPRQGVDDETTRMLAAVGVTVSEEGRARARAKLRAAAQRMTPEAWERLEEHYGRTGKE